jgi:hypothetical protein
MALDPVPRRSMPPRHAAVAADSQAHVELVHPQAVAPTTTVPPSAAAAGLLPSPTAPRAGFPTSTPPAAPPSTAPHPIAPTTTSAHPIVPPANPTSNVAASPEFATICRPNGNESGPCLSAIGQATTTARADEGLGAMVLPSNFGGLTAGEQLFVLTDIERVDRGLPAVVGMVQQLNDDAQAGAAGNTDPTPSSLPPGTTALAWTSNWAEAAGPSGSNYNWMYDDGPGSGDLGCTSSNPGSCWGHRDNELGFNASQVAASHGVLVMGAAEAAVSGDAPWSSDTELIALVTGAPTYTYTWAQAQAAGAR